MSRSHTKTRFSANDAALVLIDHQSGIMQLVHVAQRITRTREDAEDAVQDALLSAFVHMNDFEGRSRYGTWLTRITVNSALMMLRRKRATRETAMGDNNECGDGLRYEITDHAPNPETRYAQSEERRILRTAIQCLRPNLRVVAQIHLQGHSMRETAQTLGISLSAAKARMFKARKVLLTGQSPLRGSHAAPYEETSIRPSCPLRIARHLSCFVLRLSSSPTRAWACALENAFTKILYCGVVVRSRRIETGKLHGVQWQETAVRYFGPAYCNKSIGRKVISFAGKLHGL